MFRAWAFAARLQGTIEENTLKAIHEKALFLPHWLQSASRR
ncbi:hypothetical protein [Allobaculum sp. Allo2]|nr:hypothetical protein [Allobaculum sp. Allo2]